MDNFEESGCRLSLIILCAILAIMLGSAIGLIFNLLVWS